MHTVSRDLKSFSAAHRLTKGYQGKCRHLHGHTYRVRVVLSAGCLDRYDFVMDFGDIKRLFDTWVQQHWDHATLVSEQDSSLLDFLVKERQSYFVIPGQRNTTSEVLAEFLFNRFNTILDASEYAQTSIRLLEVSVSESDYSHASFVAANP
jgi:6-pyruvoyltetrahydropterin/6-carboxytetrahydropterin synthase